MHMSKFILVNLIYGEFPAVYQVFQHVYTFVTASDLDLRLQGRSINP